MVCLFCGFMFPATSNHYQRGPYKPSGFFKKKDGKSAGTPPIPISPEAQHLVTEVGFYIPHWQHHHFHELAERIIHNVGPDHYLEHDVKGQLITVYGARPLD